MVMKTAPLWVIRVPNHDPEYYVVEGSTESKADIKARIERIVKGHQVEEPKEAQRP